MQAIGAALASAVLTKGAGFEFAALGIFQDRRACHGQDRTLFLLGMCDDQTTERDELLMGHCTLGIVGTVSTYFEICFA